MANGRGGLHSLLSLPGSAEGKPARLSFLEADDARIKVEMSQSGAVLAFWENRQLPVTREGTVFSFSIPDQAASLPASSIRIYGQNESGLANELSIPLES
ncbi:hypothetical protein RZS08_27410, partial [Arthrospira platensis SPKY1]|nr:hypothetical protein [Arthrospira platensis SPKY1]